LSEHDQSRDQDFTRWCSYTNPVSVIVITDRSATLVDHIYYSEGSYKNNNNSVKTGNIWCNITDHLPNYILITNDEDAPKLILPIY